MSSLGCGGCYDGTASECVMWSICYSVLSCSVVSVQVTLFFFNDTATTEIYTLSLHDALPILECEV